MAGYEVGSAYLSILPSTKGFASNLSKDLDGPFTQAGREGGKKLANGVDSSSSSLFSGFGKKVGKLFAGAFAAVGVASVASAISDFIGDSITAASDLNETLSKTKQVFGDASKDVVSFSKTTASALGQSQQQALDGAATFGIFGKSAGLTGKPLADFSTGLVGLAGDLASFNNTSPEDAINAIGSALRGESEPIRAYGVLLDDATLKARAMSLGLIQASVDETKVAGARLDLEQATKKLATVQKEHGTNSIEYAQQVQTVAEKQAALDKAVRGTTEGALTPQQRVLAAHAEILAQTGDAQGDFAKTSDGLANSQRIASAEFANMRAEIGTALLPVVTDLFHIFIDEGVPALKDMAKWFTENKDSIRDLVIVTVTSSLGFIQALLRMGEASAWVNEQLINAFSSINNAFFFFVQGMVDGAAQAFGWVPGLGPKLREASDQVHEMADKSAANFDGLKASAHKVTDEFGAAAGAVGSLKSAVGLLNGTKAVVTLDVNGNAVSFFKDGSFRGAGSALTARAGGGPVTAGTPYLVGENSPELFVPDRNGMIYNPQQLAAMGSGTGQQVTINATANPTLAARYAQEVAQATELAWRDANATAGVR